MDNFKVALNMSDTIEKLEKELCNGYNCSEKVNSYTIMSDNKHMVIVLVYEKYYRRVGNKLSLTVTVDNMEGCTSVHCVGAGGSKRFTNVDFGACSEYASEPRKILSRYI